MVIGIERRAPSAEPGREVKFEVLVKPIDEHHTHGELTRCDRAAVVKALVKAADEIQRVLSRNGVSGGS